MAIEEQSSKKRKRRGGKGKGKGKGKSNRNTQNKIVSSLSLQPNTHKKKSNKHDGVPSNSSSSNISKSSSFIDKMKARLTGGHFRMLNEKLYTCTGEEALKYFKEDPSLFNLYHTGYQEQMSHWPELPVNVIIKWLKDRSTSLVVADFGCGDARLGKNVKNKVYSIDLVASDPSVIACDMSKCPNKAHTIKGIFALYRRSATGNGVYYSVEPRPARKDLEE